MASLYIVLDRIHARLAIADAIALTDYAKAERLIGLYVDTEVARLRLHS